MINDNLKSQKRRRMFLDLKGRERSLRNSLECSFDFWYFQEVLELRVMNFSHGGRIFR
jgi:hypothetical protein